MEIKGRVTNGKVELDGGHSLPEGTPVVVLVRNANEKHPVAGKRVQFPLFPSKQPGSLELSGQRIAELLEDEDLSSGR